MKKLRRRKKIQFLMSIFLLASIMSFSQTEEGYLNTLEVVKKGFNENNASLIYDKFHVNLKSSFEKDSLEKMIDSLRQENGIMKSYDLILSEESFKNYLIEFENSSLLFVLGLKKEGILIFEIKNY